MSLAHWTDTVAAITVVIAAVVGAAAGASAANLFDLMKERLLES